MERIQIIAVIWGLLTGLAFIPLYEAVHFGFLRIWSPVGSSLRTIFILLLATLAACAAIAFVILVPGDMLGILPLHSNSPYFFIPFMVGGLATRVFIQISKRYK